MACGAADRASCGQNGNDGRIHLANVPPGEATVYAATAAAITGQGQGSVTVLSGQHTTLQLTLLK